jgi:SAM-dependent methyltransferase
MKSAQMHGQDLCTAPLYCGFAVLNSILSDGWAAQVRALLSRPSGPPRVRGWDRHWARVWEFPWAYQVIRGFSGKNGHPRKILESGCGVTPVPFWLGSDGHQVTGMDLDESCSSEWAKGSAVCGLADGQVRFERGDMEELPFRDASFDIVYSISALEHTSRPAKAVAEMCRVCSVGGLVLLTCDVDVMDSDSLRQEQLDEIQEVLGASTTSFLPFRAVSAPATLTFENRSVMPSGKVRLALKSALHSLGLKSRCNHCIFAYAGVKRRAKAEDPVAWGAD